MHAVKHTYINALQDIAKLLLDNGANVNAYGGRYGNLLYDIIIAKLLLDNGADVNAQGGE
jgi:hypothetical protein